MLSIITYTSVKGKLLRIVYSGRLFGIWVFGLVNGFLSSGAKFEVLLSLLTSP